MMIFIYIFLSYCAIMTTCVIGYAIKHMAKKDVHLCESVFNCYYNSTQFKEMTAWMMTVEHLRAEGKYGSYRYAKQRLKEARERHRNAIVYIQPKSGRQIKAVEYSDLKPTNHKKKDNYDH